MQREFINNHTSSVKISIVPDTWPMQPFDAEHQLLDNPCPTCPDNPINKTYNPFNNGVCDCDFVPKGIFY